MKTALYSHFDAAGALLYVGISLNSIQRTAQHKHGAKWFEQIAHITIEWHQTRAAALTAEAIAIAREAPLHNLARPAGAPRPLRFPWPQASNEVRVRGEALSQVIWQGEQWAVTERGIEARDGTYFIDANRLLRKRAGTKSQYDWPLHMREKEWVDQGDFDKAFVIGCLVHHRVPITQHFAEAR